MTIRSIFTILLACALPLPALAEPLCAADGSLDRYLREAETRLQNIQSEFTKIKNAGQSAVAACSRCDDSLLPMTSAGTMTAAATAYTAYRALSGASLASRRQHGARATVDMQLTFGTAADARKAEALAIQEGRRMTKYNLAAAGISLAGGALAYWFWSHATSFQDATEMSFKSDRGAMATVRFSDTPAAPGAPMGPLSTADLYDLGTAKLLHLDRQLDEKLSPLRTEFSDAARIADAHSEAATKYRLKILKRQSLVLTAAQNMLLDDVKFAHHVCANLAAKEEKQGSSSAPVAHDASHSPTPAAADAGR